MLKAQNAVPPTHRSILGRGVILTFGAVVLCGLLGVPALTAQAPDQGAERKVISRVEPDYPEALKRLYIGGVVRVEAVVAPNGKVITTKLLGGSPILGQSTMKAVKQWKYAPAAAEQTVIVRMEFDPHR